MDPNTDEFHKPGSPIAAPLRTTAIIVYATLALLAVTIPQATVNWLTEFTPNRTRDALLTVAHAVQDASHRVGLDWPYREGRRLFLMVTNKRDD